MIQKAEKEDYSRLSIIWESAVKATHDFLKEEDFLFYQSRITTYFDFVELYLFRDENGIVKGFVGVSDDKVEMLFVANEYRSRGIGKKLLNFAVESLKCTKVDVNAQNTQAVVFYENFGFVETEYSELDSEGKCYPVIGMQLKQQ